MDIPELIKALDAEIAQQEAELQRLRKKLQLLGEIEALEEMKQLKAKATPIAWYVTGCSTMLDEVESTLRALSATHPTQQGLELANCKGGKWLTVVYHDIQPGDESRTIGEHPKVSALSWSHALNDRDAALAAQAKQGGV